MGMLWKLKSNFASLDHTGSCLSLSVLGPVELMYRQVAAYLPPSLKLALGRCLLVNVPTRDDTALNVRHIV
jgi:hypothetical protein